MIMSKKKFSRQLALIVALVMVLGPFSSLVNAIGTNSKVILLKESNNEIAMGKIEEVLREDLEKEEVVEGLVHFKDKLDSEMVANATRNALSSTMTPDALQKAVRRAVIQALEDKAQESQSNLINYLDQEKDKGNVEEYQSFFIANVVYVKASREVIENIAYMTEVKKIYKNKTHTLERPIVSEENIELSAEGVEWNIERVKADQVWELGIDGTGAVIGSLDSGVDWTHKALKDKWRGYDPVTGETNPEGNWFDPVYTTW